MRIRKGNDSDIGFARPKGFRCFFNTSLLDDICEPYVGDWLYVVFDESEPIDELAHESLRDSWDAVGVCLSDTLSRSCETRYPSLDPSEERDFVKSR